MDQACLSVSTRWIYSSPKLYFPKNKPKKHYEKRFSFLSSCFDVVSSRDDLNCMNKHKRLMNLSFKWVKIKNHTKKWKKVHNILGWSITIHQLITSQSIFDKHILTTIKNFISCIIFEASRNMYKLSNPKNYKGTTNFSIKTTKFVHYYLPPLESFPVFCISSSELKSLSISSLYSCFEQ